MDAYQVTAVHGIGYKDNWGSKLVPLVRIDATAVMVKHAHPGQV